MYYNCGTDITVIAKRQTTKTPIPLFNEFALAGLQKLIIRTVSPNSSLFPVTTLQFPDFPGFPGVLPCVQKFQQVNRQPIWNQ